MKQVITIFLFLSVGFQCQSQSNIIVLQSDFGLKDGAVSAMKGVAFSVSSNLKMFDLTHEIPPYNIWEAAYRLKQTASFWPAGTVFVSVVDPGVGSERRSVVMKSKSGHYFVTPDNGTLTLVSETLGVDQLRLIDEKINRLPNSNESYTFHGRDVYAYTAARLASGVIRFEEVGPKSDRGPVIIPFQAPVVDNKTVTGTIEILDVQYGNLWTNIDGSYLMKLDIHYGDKIDIIITNGDQVKYTGLAPFGKTFADVNEGAVVAYLNSLLNLSVAINQGNFSDHYGIFSGPEWKISIAKHKD
jgi:S-adenosylmethionine hydrolase